MIRRLTVRLCGKALSRIASNIASRHLLSTPFLSPQVRNSVFAAFIDGFTSNTYVMVEMSDPKIPSEATLINIRNARKHFEKLEKVSSSAPQYQ